MKYIFLAVFLFSMSGCAKVTQLTSSAKNGETEQTGDPVYDSQSEVKLLLPWTWII